MKKLTLLLAAVAISVLSFGQGKVTYELNGGITNEQGWQSKADMCLELQKDYLAMFPAMGNKVNFNGGWVKDSTDGNIYYHIHNGKEAVWVLPEEAQGLNAEVGSFLQNITYSETLQLGKLLDEPKWQWFKTFINETRQKAGNPIVEDPGNTESTQEGCWRAEISGFFLCSPAITDYRHTNNYVLAGKVKAFQPYWKHGFAGPETYTATDYISLSDIIPYKEGESFLGWYADPEMRTKKVKAIQGTGDLTLYAKFGEYIPTIEEIVAIAEGTDTTTQGTVTFIADNKVYIQDETGGIALNFAAAPTCKVADWVIVRGKKATKGGVTNMDDVTLTSADAADPALASATSIYDIVIGEAKSKYMHLLIKLEGAKLKGYTAEGDAILTNGTRDITCVNVKLDQNVFSPGVKVDAFLVVDYNEGFYFLGNAADITKSATAGKDPTEYPKVHSSNLEYQLTNNWLFSNTLNNYTSNRPNENPQWCRAWIQKDGKLYFTWRNHENNPTEIKLKVVDAETGTMLDDLEVAKDIFRVTTTNKETGETSTSMIFGAMQDIKLDDAGNVLVCNLLTSATSPWQIWLLDLTTNPVSGTLLVDGADIPEKFKEYSVRFDAIGVSGDVTKDAKIMAASSNTADVYFWRIKDGKWTGNTIQVPCETRDLSFENFGTAPQIFPIDGDMFYVDGFNGYPVLFDSEGYPLDWFEATSDLVKGPNGVARSVAFNGLVEFEIAGVPYLLMAGDNNEGKGGVKSSFVLFQCKDENRIFAEMTMLYEFPAIGLGGSANPYRTATPSVKVDDVNHSAEMYIYSGENGYGSYTITASPYEGLDNVVFDNGINVTVEGKTIVLSETAAVEVFAVTGQKVAQSASAQRIDVADNGVYMVRTINAAGASVAKVIVK